MQGVLSTRSVLRITGADARNFLQGLVTQDVLHLAEGSAAFAALLTPQGKILFDFFLVPHGESFLIDCAASAASALLKRLAIYRLRAKVGLEDEPRFAIAIGDYGARAIASFADPRLQQLPCRSILPREDGGAAADGAYDAARVALGVPEFGADFASDEVYLLDVNYDALHAVSYGKGCFVGQEVTSRMKRKGEVRKRTVIGRALGAPPRKGAAVMAGEAAIGETLSGAGGAFLALIRLDRLEAAQKEGAALTAGGAPLQISFPPYLERD